MQKDESDRLKRLTELVESRSKIMGLSLAILKVMRTEDVSTSESTLNKRHASLMVGIVFSLWRAVFLFHQPKNWEATLSDAQNFLEKVIADHIINFADDFRERGWSFAYYINNAHLRMRLLCAEMPELRQALLPSELSLIDESLVITHETETLPLLNSYIVALTTALECFKARLNAN
jgi:hypothetical protein